MLGGFSLDRVPVESGYGPGYKRIGVHSRVKPFKQKRRIDHEFERAFGVAAATLLDKGWGISVISEEAYDLSAAKFAKATPCYSAAEIRELMVAGNKTVTEFLNVTGSDCREFTHDEAFSALNMATASGPMFRRPLKRECALRFKIDTGMELQPWLLATYDRLLAGEDCPIYGTAPKEEIRPASKIESKSTRNTMGSPIDRSYHGLRLFGDVAERFYANYVLPCSPHVVGHSKFYRGWHTHIVGRLRKFDSGYSVDYEKFEASVNVAVMTLFARFLHAACAHETAEFHTRIDHYVRHLPYTTMAMANGEVCRKFNGNPSGDFLTLMLATFADRLFQHLWWSWLAPQLNIHEHMAVVIVGDDNTFTLSPAAHKFVTFEKIRDALRRYDIGVTTECESPRHWSELDFLSHETRCVDGLFVPVPCADKLMASMAYVRSSTTDAVKLARAAAFYIEAFYHPKAKEFRDYRDKLCQRFALDASSDMQIARSLCWPDYRIHELYSLPAHKGQPEGVLNSPNLRVFERQSAMPPKKSKAPRPAPKKHKQQKKAIVGNVRSIPRPVPDKFAGFSPWMRLSLEHKTNKVLLSMLNVYQLLGIANPIVNVNGTSYQVLTQNSRFTVKTPGVSGSSAKLDMVVYPSLEQPLFVANSQPVLGAEAIVDMEFSDDTNADNCLSTGVYDTTTPQRCVQPPSTLSQPLAAPLRLVPTTGEPAYIVAPAPDPSTGKFLMPIDFFYDGVNMAGVHLSWTPSAGGGAPSVIVEYRSSTGVWTAAATATRAAPVTFANISASFNAIRLRFTNSSGVSAVYTTALSLRVSTLVNLIAAPKSWLGYNAKPALAAMARTLNVTSEGSDVPVTFLGRTGWVSRTEGSLIQAGQFTATQVRARSLDQLSADENELVEKPGTRQIPLAEGMTFVIKPYNFQSYGVPTGFRDAREDLFETFQSFVTCDSATTFTVRILTCIGVEVNNNVLGGASTVETFSLIDMQNAFNVVSALPTVLPNDNHVEQWARWVSAMLKRLGPTVGAVGSNAASVARIAARIGTMLA